MKTVLAVVAHADDELLGCGGTLRRHVDEGDEVHVIIAADCRTVRSPGHTPGPVPEAEAVAACLGFDAPVFLCYAGMALSALPELELNNAIGKAIGWCPKTAREYWDRYEGAP